MRPEINWQRWQAEFDSMKEFYLLIGLSEDKAKEYARREIDTKFRTYPIGG